MTNTTQNQIKEENTPETTVLSEDEMQDVSGGFKIILTDKLKELEKFIIPLLKKKPKKSS
ncbi:MAG: hypothetical protein MJ250_07910 [Alphaproteobacteria bacterium]|nr:hypothetical protein [Alphaproteobacteria bacterium]